jgi:hypothetical protein
LRFQRQIALLEVLPHRKVFISNPFLSVFNQIFTAADSSVQKPAPLFSNIDVLVALVQDGGDLKFFSILRLN